MFAMLAAYQNRGAELTCFEILPNTEAPILAKRILWNEQIKGFVWKQYGLAPLFKGELSYHVDVENTIVKNGDFESYIGNAVQFWKALGGIGGQYVKWETTETGNRNILVTSTETDSKPYAYQIVQAYSDTAYKLSLSCVQEDVSGDTAAVALEFYDKDGGGISSQVVKLSCGQAFHSFEFETPSGGYCYIFM